MKIGIITINDNNNYGNRLQNFALQQILMKKGFEVVTLKNNPNTNNLTRDNKKILISKCKKIIKQILRINTIPKERIKCFEQFNKYINFSKKTATAKSSLEQYSYLITGSDQVWNPCYGRLSDVDLLNFKGNIKKISFSASFGIDVFSSDELKKIKENLKLYDAISVRESSGKNLLENQLNFNDVELLLDPTMLVDLNEWNNICKRPIQFEQLKHKKFILNYFLGNISEARKKEIERIAIENNCDIINILDKKDPFYITGPSEFLYLEKNAFLICTDSFHSSVFGILFNTPFLVFDREDKDEKMNSRIDTLLSKFKLEDRRFNGKITTENLKLDCSEAYKILEVERKKAEVFLKKALDIDNIVEDSNE